MWRAVVTALAMVAVAAAARVGRHGGGAQGHHWVSDLDALLGEERHVARRAEGEGCLLYMEDRRFEPRGAASFEDQSNAELPYWLATRIINRAYAERHKYRFVATTGKEFAKFGARHTSWYKIKFAQQQLQCCCKWVFYIDSDAYFRMEDHSLSVEDWLARLPTKGYFKWIEDMKVNMDNQTWFPHPPSNLLKHWSEEGGLIALVPRNGDSRDDACGGHRPKGLDEFFPEEGKRTCGDGFVNAGTFLLRNSSLTHEFLEEWFNDPSERFHRLWPWEQGRLSDIAWRYKRHIAVVPLKEMTGFKGRAVRHYWKGPVGDDTFRQRTITRALLYFMALKEERTMGGLGEGEGGPHG